MSAIDFPLLPTIGDKYAAGSTMWQFNGETWTIAPYIAPNLGIVDGGKPSNLPAVVIVNAGNPASTFSSNSIDCGGVS